MSAFAFKVQKTVEIPGLAGQTAVIKKLGWKALDAARQAVSQRGLEMVRAIGWSEIQKTVADKGGTEAVQAKASADPFLQYDVATLLERGVVSWTLEEEVSPTSIAELDEAVAVGLARDVFALSKPRTEEERKNA